MRYNYYHVTPVFLGPRKILNPRHIKQMYEPEEYAICVSPTVVGCMMALPQRSKTSRSLYLYVTDEPVRTKPAKFVHDYARTGERRIYRDCRFRLVCKLEDVPPRPSDETCAQCSDAGCDVGQCGLCLYEYRCEVERYCNEHNL